MALAFLLLLVPVAVRPAQEIETVIERLKTEDSGARRKAMEELLARGPEAVAAALRTLEVDAPDLTGRVAELVRGLSSRKWKARHEATRALALLGRHAREHLESRQNASDPEVAWRIKAALVAIEEKAGRERRLEDLRDRALWEFLGEAGDARGVGPILRLLGDPEKSRKKDLSLRAAEAAAKLRDRMTDEEAERAADRVLALLAEGSDPFRRSRLVKALAGLRCAACVRPLTTLFRDRRETNLNLKRNCMAALAASGEAAGVKAVVDALLSDQVYVREGAATLLDGLRGAASGYDPLVSLEKNREAIEAYRAWWAKKFGREWRD